MPSPRAQSIGLSRGDIDALRRVHIVDPVKWGVSVGTDYWFYGGANGIATAGGNNLITDGGWTNTSMVLLGGSGADFMTKSDVGVPNEVNMDAAADLLTSPAIFGDYAHSHAAAVIMGRSTLPRYLIADCYSRFLTASANEVTTNMGFIEDGGSPVVAADTLLTVYSDSAKFSVQANAAVKVGVTAVDNAYHWFRLLLDKQNALGYVFVDGVLANSIAITTDEWPAKFGLGAGTTNRIGLNQAHIWYAWNLPRDLQDF